METETENQNKINFLDLTLHRIRNTIRTEWYTKKTWSSRYLHYNSVHPISQKRSVILGLADRSIELTDPEFRTNAIRKAKEALIKNNYPNTLIESIFKKRIHRFYNKNTFLMKKDKSQTQKYLTLPYIPGLSQNLQNIFKHEKITTCHKAHNLLKNNFSTLKSKIPKDKKSNVVYKIPCNGCSSVYIGQTSQYIKNRMNGHKFDKKNKTALTNHMTETNHMFDFNNVKILKTENHTKKREFYEMIEIQKNKNTINSKTDTKQLSKIYNNLFK